MFLALKYKHCLFVSIILLLQPLFHVFAQSLEAGFHTPPNEARPRGYWVLVNGNFSLSQMTEELKEFKDKGMGGVDIWDVAGWVDENKVVPAGPKFMEEQSLQAIAHGIREGKRLGLLIGLTISSSWNAGGDWVKPEDGVMGLFSSKIEVDGGQSVELDLPFPNFPITNQHGDSLLINIDEKGKPQNYEEVSVLAYPTSIGDSITIDYTKILFLDSFIKNGKLKWKVPTGKWTIERFVGVGTGQPLMQPSPNSNGLMIDHFSAEAMERNMNFFFDKLEAKLGPLSESGLEFLYTDSYEANSATWTSNMAKKFEDRNGYSILRYLPSLTGKIVQDIETTERFLFDFRQTLSDLIIDNHYALGTKMANQKGIGFIAEAGGPGPPLHNTPFESLRALGVLDVPRGEFWFDTLRDSDRTEHTQIVKGPATAAHLYNRPRVEAEAFTGTQLWQFGPGDLKQSADRAMAEGLTSFVYHTTPHIPPEAGSPGWVYNFGTLVNTTRTWWPKSKAFHEYLGRSCFLLQQGHFVGDILFYYGDEAPNFIDHNANRKRLGFGYDYDGLNTDILLNRLTVKDGYFTLPHGPKYKVLVLPNSEAINPKVLKKVEEFLKAGGTVIGDAPKRAHGLLEADKQDAEVQELAKSLWIGEGKRTIGKGTLYDAYWKVSDVLMDVNVPKDVEINLKDAQQKIRFLHRHSKEFDIYFLQNQGEDPLVFEATFRTVKGSPQLWDAYAETIIDQHVFIQQDNRTRMPMYLEGNASIFVVFQKNNQHKGIAEVRSETEILFPNPENTQAIIQQKEGYIIDKPINYKGEMTNGYEVKPENVKSLEGTWELRFEHGWGAPQSLKVTELKSLTDFDDSFIKHYSGMVAYHLHFEWDSPPSKEGIIELDLGEVSKVAEVYLNGHRVQTLWSAPFKTDVTPYLQEGINYLVVEVANVMVNRLIGDAKGIYGDLKRTHSNITKAPNAWMTPHKDAELIPSGLMGPVLLISKPKITW